MGIRNETRHCSERTEAELQPTVRASRMVTLEFTAHSWDRLPEMESSDGEEDSGSEDADASDN